MSFLTRSGSDFMLNGAKFRFNFVNQYAFVIDTMSQADAALLMGYAKLDGISVFRTWCFDRGNPPTNSAGNFRYLSGGVLNWREATFVQLDMILDEARKAGLKLILSLADNPTFNTKKTYVDWANALYGVGLSTAYPYEQFFISNYCKQLYKDFFYKLATRVNTINGRTYKDDDTIAWWEEGNELRFDKFDAEGGTQNTAASYNIATTLGWANEMAQYFKSVDPNHMVNFGAMSHTWQWVNGDTISNGSGYGVDYNLFAASAYLDMVDFHIYPTQANPNQLQNYGQRLGFPNSPTGRGLTAQIQDFVRAGKANNKPTVCSEVSITKEYRPTDQDYPLQTRLAFIKRFYEDFFGAGGNAVGWWSYSMGNAGYEIYAGGSDGPNVNPNFDDNPVLSFIRQYAYKLNGKRIPVEGVTTSI